MNPPIIIGAGLAGLIAAHAWPHCAVLERSPEPSELHRALLRFRTDAVARLVGVEFRRVTVRKGIYTRRGGMVPPNIRLANSYSQKCLSALLSDRSIWNLDPVERFIAPDNLYEQLIASVGSRITWNCTASFGLLRRQTISTAPLPATLDAIGIQHELAFNRAHIFVRRATVPRCDVYQTIYFPDEEMPVYRASITGSTLIVEMTRDADPEDWMGLVSDAFCLPEGVEVESRVHEQRFGKIAPVDDAARKALLLRLTRDHDIFSLGRFATWRNILLDDVVQDIDVVKRLLRGSAYDAHRELA